MELGVPLDNGQLMKIQVNAIPFLMQTIPQVPLSKRVAYDLIHNYKSVSDIHRVLQHPDVIIGADYFYEFVGRSPARRLTGSLFLVQSSIRPMLVGEAPLPSAQDHQHQVQSDAIIACSTVAKMNDFPSSEKPASDTDDELKINQINLPKLRSRTVQKPHLQLKNRSQIKYSSRDRNVWNFATKIFLFAALCIATTTSFAHANNMNSVFKSRCTPPNNEGALKTKIQGCAKSIKGTMPTTNAMAYTIEHMNIGAIFCVTLMTLLLFGTIMLYAEFYHNAENGNIQESSQKYLNH
ncbi:unnamed protein product [Anisakis simplex]|uniref:DUF1758 domain-containing protein n=1 Tax=Anisakis simplex TaxID=6269 RepID=A0A0M3J098_ANISI|nr:unnamed protein product [Anisakis simplex]